MPKELVQAGKGRKAITRDDGCDLGDGACRDNEQPVSVVTVIFSDGAMVADFWRGCYMGSLTKHGWGRI
jgi:hypothetical protein